MPSDLVPTPDRRPRILCVDDEPAIRDVLCALLRREGYEAESASNGQEAWRKLTAEQGNYDLLISDNDMPFVTGSQLVKQAREAEMEMKILVFSASLTPGDEHAFRSWGVDAIVTKGSPIDELLCTVRRLLQATSVNAPDRVRR